MAQVPYSGAVPIIPGNKFGEMPSILDYVSEEYRSAIRRGIITDDITANIQGALDSISSRGGGRVHAPAGLYPCKDFDIPDKVILTGEGRSSLFSRIDDIDAGRGMINIDSLYSGVENIGIEGNVTTTVGLQYNVDFTGVGSNDPMADSLTENTSIWIHPGARGTKLVRPHIEHTGGYSVLIDARDGDIFDVLIDHPIIRNCRPNTFGLSPGSLIYGAWNSGIHYQCDGRASEGKLYSVKGLKVTGAFIERITGSAIWGHCYGFDAMHTQVNLISNILKDIGFHGCQLGNVNNGSVVDNNLRRIGYVPQDDTSPCVPKYLSNLYASAIDMSGLVKHANVSNNVVLNANGDCMDLDGLCFSDVVGNTLAISSPGEYGYVEDQIDSIGPNDDGVSATYGIQTGNTNILEGGSYVNISDNTIKNMAEGAIRLYAFRQGKCINNRIYHPANATRLPIVIGPVGTDPAQRAYDSSVTDNDIHYSPTGSALAAIFEDEQIDDFDPSERIWYAHNKVYGNCYGLRKCANSGSIEGTAYNSGVADSLVQSMHIVAREGKASDYSSALKWYLQEASSAWSHMQLQGYWASGQRGPLLNVSEGGTKGVIATGPYTTSSFSHAVLTGKVYADGFYASVWDSGNSPENASHGHYAEANTLPAGTSLLYWNGALSKWRQSTSVSSGIRVWSDFSGGSGSPGGSNTHVQFNDAGALGGTADFVFDKTNKVVTITGVAATAGLVVATGYIQTDAGVLSTLAGYQSIYASGGGFFGNSANIVHYIAVGSHASPTQSVGDNWSSGPGVFYYDNTTSSQFWRFKYGTGASTLGDANIATGGYYASGTAANTIQAPNGGVTAKWLVATDSAFLVELAAPSVSSSGQSRIYMDSTTHIPMISVHGAAYIPLVGNLYWQRSGTTLLPLTSGDDVATSGLFNSTATGASLCFQGGGGNFQVDGAGNISAAGNVVAVGYGAFSGLLVNANSSAPPTAVSGTLAHVAAANSSNSRVLVDSFSAITFFTGRRSNGTAASPTALAANDAITSFAGMGYGTSAYSSGTRVGINCYAAENWTNSAQGSYLGLFTTPTGSTTPAISWMVSAAGHFLAFTDNTYTIGASGANRPSKIWTMDLDSAGALSAGGTISSSATGASICFQAGGGNLQISGAGNISSVGTLTLSGTGSGINVSGASGASINYNAIQVSGGGGMYARSFTALKYVQVGTNSGAPSATAGDSFNAGALSWDTSGTPALKVYDGSNWLAIATGATTNYWQRSGTTLLPLTSGDDIATSGLFNSTATGSSFCFQGGGGNFLVDGNGNMSLAATAAVGGVNVYSTVPSFLGIARNGSIGSPTAVTIGQVILQLAAYGYGATGYSAGSRASIWFNAAQNWTDSVQGANISFITTPNGSTTAVTRWLISDSGHVLAASDNAYAIGASGANRPSKIWTMDLDSAGALSAGGTISSSATGASICFQAGGGNLQISGAGNISSVGTLTLSGTGSGINVSGASGASINYNAIQVSGGGGMYARSFTALKYVQVGTNSGAPSATAGDSFNAGALSWDTSGTPALKVYDGSNWLAIATGATTNYWQRSGIIVSPVTSGDTISTSGLITGATLNCTTAFTVSGTSVVDSSRNLVNIAAITAASTIQTTLSSGVAFQAGSGAFQAYANGNINGLNINCSSSGNFQVNGTTVITGAGAITNVTSITASSTIQTTLSSGVAFQAGSGNFQAYANGNINGLNINCSSSGSFQVNGTTVIDSDTDGTFRSVTTSSSSLGVIQSACTSTNIAFQTTNFNFQVNGNGVVSCQQVNVSGSTAIDSSRRFVGAGTLCGSSGIGGGGFNPWNGSGYDTGASGSITVASTSSITVSGGVITGWTPSDSAVKSLIRHFDEGLEVVRKLRPVVYRFNELAKSLYHANTDKQHVGFFADEVVGVLPDACERDEHGHWTYSDRGVMGAVVNSINQLDSRLQSLEAKLKVN